MNLTGLVAGIVSYWIVACTLVWIVGSLTGLWYALYQRTKLYVGGIALQLKSLLDVVPG
jgi:hypothetical protein|nr:hypothetical protein Q903MT_gene4866 [Picea sitchensis]